MKRFELVDADPDGTARRAIAVVLADVQHAVAARDLHVQRHAGLEAMLPVDLEAEPVDVELAGLAFVEAPQDRNDRVKAHAAAIQRRHRRDERSMSRVGRAVDVPRGTRGRCPAWDAWSMSRVGPRQLPMRQRQGLKCGARERRGARAASECERLGTRRTCSEHQRSAAVGCLVGRASQRCRCPRRGTAVDFDRVLKFPRFGGRG